MFDQSGLDIRKYRPDPDRASSGVIEAFVQHLEERVGERVTDLRGAIAAEQAEIEHAHRDLVVDEPAHYNLRMVAAVLAARRILSRTMSGQALLSLLEEAFTGPYASLIRSGTRTWLDAESDPFRAMVALVRTREREDFGKGFTLERERDDDAAYLLNVRRCFYHDVFAAEGAAELTPIFCAFDRSWIDGIDPDRHGFRFERPTTIGLGGSICPFHFRRVGDPPR
jgi:hypothetical protein